MSDPRGGRGLTAQYISRKRRTCKFLEKAVRKFLKKCHVAHVASHRFLFHPFNIIKGRVQPPNVPHLISSHAARPIFVGPRSMLFCTNCLNVFECVRMCPSVPRMCSRMCQLFQLVCLATSKRRFDTPHRHQLSCQCTCWNVRNVKNHMPVGKFAHASPCANIIMNVITNMLRFCKCAV